VSTGSLDRSSRVALHALLIWAPLAFGTWDSVAQTVAFVVVALTAAAWLAAGLRAGELEWRRTPLDPPVALRLALVAADGRDADARFGLGLVREATGAADQALEDDRVAVTLEPRMPRYRKRLADRLWRSERFFQVLNEWRTLKAQAPRDLEVRLALARGLEKIGQPGDAYREYREVLQLQPEQPDADRAVARLEGRGR
jgi:tetratricopeptide (TPR) repeat protein